MQTASAPKKIWNTLELINWTRGFFEKKQIESPRLEAELLLAAVLDCSRVSLYTNFEVPVDEADLARFREFVRRRGELREPYQYIVGQAEFLDLKLKVSPAVLIPRPETEQLAEWALAKLAAFGEASPLVLDIGTGSGCLGLALAAKIPTAQVTATDMSAAALAVAAENRSHLGLEERVTLLESDLFKAIPEDLKGRVTLIVSNPPYIAPELRDTLAPEVLRHEPETALFAPDHGLGIIRDLIAQAAVWLRSGGWLGLEISPELGNSIRELLEAESDLTDETLWKDHGGRIRFAAACRK